jgi:uncharacterized membrane protein YedE/YeeE
MTIDWGSFTLWPALAGGLMIGMAAASLALLNGRLAGVSGILGGLLVPRGLLVPGKGDTAWRVAFLAGLVAAPAVYALVATVPAARIDAGTGPLAIGGLLVGIGARYGAGCTSGHGVCGLSRLSARSLVATLVFMCTGFLTVFFTRHLIGN